MVVEIRGDHLQPRARYCALRPDDLLDHDVAHAGVSLPVVKRFQGIARAYGEGVQRRCVKTELDSLATAL